MGDFFSHTMAPSGASVSRWHISSLIFLSFPVDLSSLMFLFHVCIDSSCFLFVYFLFISVMTVHCHMIGNGKVTWLHACDVIKLTDDIIDDMLFFSVVIGQPGLQQELKDSRWPPSWICCGYLQIFSNNNNNTSNIFLSEMSFPTSFLVKKHTVFQNMLACHLILKIDSS